MKKILFLLFSLFSLGLQAQQALSPVQVAERNKPGTVMIQATFKGTVSALQPVTDEEKVKQLAQEIRAGLEAENRYSEDLFWNTFLMTYCARIDQYLTSGTQKLSKELNTTMVGSGFIITPDGYVVTNAHVVDENDETTKQRFAEQAFQEILEADLADVEKTVGRKLTEEESKALINANTWYFSQVMEVSDISTEYSIVFGVTGDNGKIVPLVLPASLVTRGAAIPGKDVAILKLKDKHVYPTIRVGDDQSLRVGEQIYVLGYPAVATFHPLISEESVAEATLTRGIISARKNMKDGWEVLQTDASITHGNSGGPVMNEKGEVIGLATFGSIDEQRGQEVQGMNFIVPSTIVKEFIARAGIRTEMSDVSLLYEKALDYSDKGWYKKALMHFEEVKRLSPSFPFIDKMVADTRTNVDKGLDKEPSGIDPIYYYAGGGVVLVLLLLILLLRRKRK